ncbi:MAG: type III pantothenate kinase [Chloroflexota bacterium]|nr:type III pantothenate kinase [Chloroflexota bacterium]
MLLAVDVGNTNTVFGVYDLEAEMLVTTVRVSSRPDRMPDEWYAILLPALSDARIDPRAISAMILSSVVPGVTRWLAAMGQSRLDVEPVLVSVDLDLGIEVDVDHPREVGADRLVNAAAARARYGAPAVVIDLGTATNFDVVDGNGAYIGGALAPGLIVAADAMVSRAARLFAVELTLPPRAIGRNTVQALQSGLVLGYLSLIEGMIQRIRGELAGTPTVIVTGGYGEIFAASSEMIDVHDPNLTIDGLHLIYQRIIAKEGEIGVSIERADGAR